MARSSWVDVSGAPSAIISDGLVTIPLYAVSQINLTESYHLPAIGTSTMRATVATHDDTISLSGLLVGDERYALKFALETLAESSKLGTALERISQGAVSGLVLISGMTVRTDLQIQSLTFTEQAQRRDVIDVSISLVYMPRPGVLAKLLDLASLGVGSLVDFGAAK